ncbi:MAG: hypothetical protein ACJ0SL_05720 [Candidatus Rariloculaceae bacterium]
MLRLFLPTLALLVAPATAEIITTTFGQAYSYAEGDSEFDVASYEGSGPALGASLGLRVNRLEIEPVLIELQMGDTISLRTFSVRAFGRNNTFVESASLTLEFEGPDDLIDMDLFMVDGHTLRADQPGIGRLWINSIAPPLRGEPFSLPVVIVVNGQRAIPQPPFLY